MSQPDPIDLLQQMIAQRGGMPGDRIIPREYQSQRGQQSPTGPMAQAVTVETFIPRFCEKVGLQCKVERNDDASGWVLTITQPPRQQTDGATVGT